MKISGRYILLTALALAATGMVAAQSTIDASEQRHKAKFGRYSAREEARIKAEQANSAYRQESTKGTPEKVSGPSTENFHKVKLGRASAAEEARARTERENSASREEIKDVNPEATEKWFRDQRFRSKYGRPAPSENNKAKGR